MYLREKETYICIEKEAGKYHFLIRSEISLDVLYYKNSLKFT